jgi:N-acetylglucosaminyl-diphospho-decaprenol L-rhamnosyltransferase
MSDNGGVTVGGATPRLGVVVLTYGAGGPHEPLLESLLAQGIAPGAILVVHNPADPGEPDPSLPPGCELLRATHNLGYAAAMNLGVERQRRHGYELLLLLTHDARLRPGALRSLLDAAAAHPRFGVLAPRLVFAGSETPFSFGGQTSRTGKTTHIAELGAVDDGIARCDWVDGGTMLIRADALRRVGDFDERFWSYCEEADLCLRISRAGYGIGVVPAAVADQQPGGSKRFGPWSYLLTRNGAAYAWRASGFPGFALFLVRAIGQVVRELLRTAARGLRLRGGPPGDTWATAVGTARGLVDLCRRRWGPPPPLPGRGDIANVEPRPEAGDRDG